MRSLTLSRSSAPSRRARLPLALLSLTLLWGACGGDDPAPAVDQLPSRAWFEVPVSNGAVGEAMHFKCAAVDPEEGPLSYGFDWGDGSAPADTLTEAVASGVPVDVEHAFPLAGRYPVRCRAVDAAGQAGPWSASVTVQVSAPPRRPRLTVTVEGQGSVRSAPDGITCGATCEARFIVETQVLLQATPAAGWRFIRWTGDCEGIGTDAQLGLKTDRRCTALFQPEVSFVEDWVRVGTSSVRGLAWSPDGSQLAAGEPGGKGVLRVWDARTAQVKHLHPQREEVRHGSVAWSGPAGLVATGLSNGTLLILDPATWDTVRELSGHTSWDVRAVAWSADGRRLASADGSGGLRLWDTSTWTLVEEHRVPEGVQRLAWSPDGMRLGMEVDSSMATAAFLLDIEAGQVERLDGRGFAWSPSGDRFALGGVGTVRVFAPGEAEPRQTLTGLGDQVIAVDWSPDGRWLAVSNQAGSLLVVEVETGRLVASVRVGGSGLRSEELRFHPTLPEVAMASNFPAEVSVFTVDAAAGTARKRQLTAHEGAARVAAWSPTGERLATGGADGTVRLWGPSGESLQRMSTYNRNGYPYSVDTLAWDAAGQRLAAGTSGGSVHLWNAADGAPVGEPLYFFDRVEQVALSADGRWLAATGYRWNNETFDTEYRLVAVWDLTTRARVAGFREGDAESQWVNAVAMRWSADGGHLLIVWDDLSWTRWEAATGAHPLTRAQGVLFAELYAAALSPDGRRLVARGFPWPLSIWDLDSGAQLAKLEGGPNPDTLAWSPDGRFIAGGTHEGRLCLWDTRVNVLVVDRPLAHSSWLEDLTWHPDGVHLTTVGWDLQVKTWRLKP